MESAKYLIIGGGVAGTTAASTIRSLDVEGRILIVEDEAHPLYSRVALPAYLRGKTSRERVFLKDEAFYTAQSIDLWCETRAVALEPHERLITLSDGRRLHYEHLLLATGGQPRTWQVPGAELTGVLPLRTIDQADEVIRRIKTAKHVTVVGGGFITLELIMTLAQEGVATTVVIREPHYWASLLDEESGRLLEQLIAQPHIDLLFNTEVVEVLGTQHVEGVLLSDGRRLQTETVLVNIGVAPDLAWLAETGLHLGNGIQTDEYLATNLPGIFAAGDIAEFYDPILKLHHHQGNWLNATVHGRLAGLNMAGKHTPLHAISSYSISVFGKNVCFIGDIRATASRVVIPRGSARDGSYGRLILDHGRLVGASLINRFTEKSAIDKLILSGADLTEYLSHLADVTHPLSEVADRMTVPAPTPPL